MKELEKGNYFAVASGQLKLDRKHKKSNEYILSLATGTNEFACVYPFDNRGVLWFFKTLNAAKSFRNLVENTGNKCGNNICKFAWDGSAMHFVEGC